MAALPEAELSMKVVQLLGLQGPLWRQVFRESNCFHSRSYSPIRVVPPPPSLLELVTRRPLWLVFLGSSAHSGT